MDWHVLGSSFVVIFLAELEDKTQLVTFGLASGSNSRLSIFRGASAALVATWAIAVLFGGAATQLIAAVWLKRAAGVAFVVLGCVFLLGRG
jgi:putative Ca2+/H+ antiporter (TMEM165/GDT1 family)